MGPPDRPATDEGEAGTAEPVAQQPSERPGDGAPPQAPGDAGEQEGGQLPPWEVSRAKARRGYPGATVLGVLLVVVGLVFLVGQQLNVDVTYVGWPLFVIGPGLALLALGLTQRHGRGLTIAGSIVTIVGLVLLYQNATDHWESWAYAWALVGPGGSGLGMLLYGARSGDSGLARAGFWQVVTAIGLFAAGFIFFEGIIGISGTPLPLPEWLLPAVVIAFGVILLIRGIVGRRETALPPG